MQEYTQMMQQMSKDMFDASFLKNFQLMLPGKAPEPYSPTSAQAGTQPKVHNLNISIHNNANYAAPFPAATTPSYTP